MADDPKLAEVEANFAAFREKLPELLKTHAGKFAVIRHGEIVEFFDTISDVANFAAQMFKDDMYSVQEVTSRQCLPGISEMGRSPAGPLVVGSARESVRHAGNLQGRPAAKGQMRLNVLTDALAADLAPEIMRLRAGGCSFRDIADIFDRRGIRSGRRGEWGPAKSGLEVIGAALRKPRVQKFESGS
jgi:hypothetical protein